MVSLLFISNSQAIDAIKTSLQSILKARIDVVADFDHGLKDVFEKRPSMVCIQEQINGVTGESVARHIQMLLGSSTPSFVLMYEANSRIKPIKGLFDHLIDLSQPTDKVIVSFVDTLKSILGSQWNTVYIPPQGEIKAELAAGIVPLESKAFADQLVDDLLTDLDSFGSFEKNELAQKELKTDTSLVDVENLSNILIQQSKSVQLLAADSTVDDSIFIVSKSDETLTLSDSYETRNGEITPPVSPPNPVLLSEKTALKVSSELETSTVSTSHQPVSIEPLLSPSSFSAPVTSISANSFDALKVDNQTPPIKLKQPVVEKNAIATDIVTNPADFTISNQKNVSEEVPEDLLLEFEKNFRSQSASRNKIIVVSLFVILVCGIGTSYLVFKKPELFSFLKKQPLVVLPSLAIKTNSSTPSKVSSPVAAVQSQHSSKVINSTQQKKLEKKLIKSESQPIKTVVNRSEANLPSFIPAKGLDRSYSIKKPGWERYVGVHEEYRLFRADGQIKALQVLSAKGKPIDENNIALMLQEIAGTRKYTVTSNEQKAGFKVSKGNISSKAELLLYRKKGTVRAFVVSLN